MSFVVKGVRFRESDRGSSPLRQAKIFSERLNKQGPSGIRITDDLSSQQKILAMRRSVKITVECLLEQNPSEQIGNYLAEKKEMDLMVDRLNVGDSIIVLIMELERRCVTKEEFIDISAFFSSTLADVFFQSILRNDSIYTEKGLKGLFEVARQVIKGFNYPREGQAETMLDMVNILEGEGHNGESMKRLALLFGDAVHDYKFSEGG